MNLGYDLQGNSWNKLKATEIGGGGGSRKQNSCHVDFYMLRKMIKAGRFEEVQWQMEVKNF